MRIKTRIRLVLWLAITALPFQLLTPAAQAQDVTFSQALILLAPEHSHRPALIQLQTLIEADGGRVTHVFPYRGAVASVSGDTIEQLWNLPTIAHISTEPIEHSQIDGYGADARYLAALWNELIAPPAAAPETGLAAAEHLDLRQDAFPAPDLPAEGKLGLASDDATTPGYYQTSEFMAGHVAVGIILLESDGSADPSTENWTDQEKQQVFNEIVAGLNWWAELEPRAHLSFVYDDHFTDPLPTGVEPITRRYYDQYTWIADAMGELGYTAPSYFTRVRDYNHYLRTTYQSDWAFTIFVVDSSNDGDNRFSDGYFAYAYLGGPFMVMTSGNNGYGPSNMDAVVAHETGHIFFALDQYTAARHSCTQKSGYLDVKNQNSQYGEECTSNTASIMRGQIYPYRVKAIDTYAAGQIGWRDSDADGILDPLDTDFSISIDSIVTTENQLTAAGTITTVPYASPSRPDVTINTLAGVRYRFDGGNWQTATADDGAFDGVVEIYRLATDSLAPGLHTLEVMALDSAGNVSEVQAEESLAIFDPLDGGLNTELYVSPKDTLAASANPTIDGVAYHMGDGIVTKVEYRINSGMWQAAAAQDGAFDSNYEQFILTIAPELISEVQLIEARAVDGNGYVEANIASKTIDVAETHTVFLPMVLNGK